MAGVPPAEPGKQPPRVSPILTSGSPLVRAVTNPGSQSRCNPGPVLGGSSRGGQGRDQYARADVTNKDTEPDDDDEGMVDSADVAAIGPPPPPHDAAEDPDAFDLRLRAKLLAIIDDDAALADRAAQYREPEPMLPSNWLAMQLGPPPTIAMLWLEDAEFDHLTAELLLWVKTWRVHKSSGAEWELSRLAALGFDSYVVETLVDWHFIDISVEMRDLLQRAVTIIVKTSRPYHSPDVASYALSRLKYHLDMHTDYEHGALIHVEVSLLKELNELAAGKGQPGAYLAMQKTLFSLVVAFESYDKFGPRTLGTFCGAPEHGMQFHQTGQGEARTRTPPTSRAST